jgi:hypothetical protein
MLKPFQGLGWPAAAEMDRRNPTWKCPARRLASVGHVPTRLAGGGLGAEGKKKKSSVEIWALPAAQLRSGLGIQLGNAWTSNAALLGRRSSPWLGVDSSNGLAPRPENNGAHACGRQRSLHLFSSETWWRLLLPGRGSIAIEAHAPVFPPSPSTSLIDWRCPSPASFSPMPPLVWKSTYWHPSLSPDFSSSWNSAMNWLGTKRLSPE